MPTTSALRDRSAQTARQRHDAGVVHPALHAITHSTVDVAAKALVFLMLFAITEIAVVGPVLAVTLLGDRAKPVLTGIHESHRQTFPGPDDLDVCRLRRRAGRVGVRVFIQVG